MSDDFDRLEDDDLLPADEAIEQHAPDRSADTTVFVPATDESDAAGSADDVPQRGLADTSASELEPVPAPETSGATGPVGERSLARYSQVQLRRARDVLSRLYAVRRGARFYPMDHPAIAESVAALHGILSTFYREGVDVRLSFFEGEVLLGEQLLTEESVQFDQLVRDMTSLGIGSLSMRRGVTVDELNRLMEVLSADARLLEQAGGITTVVRGMGLQHVEIGSVAVIERARPVVGDLAEEAKAAYGGAVSLVREMDRLLRSNRHASSAKIKGVVRSLVDNVLGNRYAMLQLTGLRNYDEYTFYHSANVAILSLALGSTVTNDYRFLSSLGVGALLHDIGKLAVDLDILNKPGALTPDEWANVREHPVQGAEMVSLLPGVDKAAVVTILEHHMRFDGTGYPARQPRRRQHLASRIVAVADSYDAMTSRRSYSAARVQDEAIALLVKSGGTSLDPVLVRLFVRLIGVYPPRSVVRLSGGEIAIVLQPSPHDPLRPVVRVIATSAGEFIAPVDIDLVTESELSVSGCIDPRLLNIEVDDYLD